MSEVTISLPKPIGCWVAVETGLPPMYEQVGIYVPGRPPAAAHRVEVQDGWLWFDGYERNYDPGQVTHWFPWPYPPGARLVA